MAQGVVPRPAPELKIVEASGRTTALSGYRGRVVLLAFISTECPHCQRVSGIFEELAREFAGKVQVAAVAFNENADTSTFAKRFGLSFPVGTGTSDLAHDFLGIDALLSDDERLIRDTVRAFCAETSDRQCGQVNTAWVAWPHVSWTSTRGGASDPRRWRSPYCSSAINTG